MDDNSESGKKQRSRGNVLQSWRRSFFPIVRSNADHDNPSNYSSNTNTLFGSRSPPKRNINETSYLPLHKLFSNKDGSTFNYTVRDKHDASGKRGFKVQVPKRMMLYTGAIFLAMPLFMFAWKELHLNHTKSMQKQDAGFNSHYQSYRKKHERYVTWMEEGALPIQDQQQEDYDNNNNGQQMILQQQLDQLENTDTVKSDVVVGNDDEEDNEVSGLDLSEIGHKMEQQFEELALTPLVDLASSVYNLTIASASNLTSTGTGLIPLSVSNRTTIR